MAQKRASFGLLAALAVASCSAQGGLRSAKQTEAADRSSVSHLRIRSAGLAAATAPAATEEEDFAAVAQAAAKSAWKYAEAVKSSTVGAGKLTKEVEKAVSEVKTAMEVAKKQDEQMELIYNESQESTMEAAKVAAMKYHQQVKAAGAAGAAVSAKGLAPEVTKDAEQEAQAKIAQAAVDAAMPYHAALLKGQKRAVDYQRRAQAMNAAGNRLQLEGARLAPHAEGYQKVGQAVEASQIIMTAHTLVDQGAKMKRQAEGLHTTAAELAGALPAYARAEKAAMLHASALAAPPTVTNDAEEPY
eukprot:TRINITY_DN8206_c0_g1_i1.p1 TRINITY_DN8206_c0_g1~~TRINITY_DN8206_c0_g1_i1.p1  ORF type:complete len:326 (+),score=90.33 TRINITY_DN8206_c0_g1_i1:74-979(+)